MDWLAVEIKTGKNQQRPGASDAAIPLTIQPEHLEVKQLDINLLICASARLVDT